MKVRAPSADTRYFEVRQLIHGSSLHTICEEARCPNIAECWGRGTATFQILGDTCTRACRYCYVHSGKPGPVDRGDDDVLQLHLRCGLRDAERLERIRRRVGAARLHVAVAARAGARVAEDLERRRSAPPALGDVRAARLLADRVQLSAVDQLLDVVVLAVLRRRAHLHPLGAARPLGDGLRRLHPRQSRAAARSRGARCTSSA